MIYFYCLPSVYVPISNSKNRNYVILAYLQQLTLCYCSQAFLLRSAELLRSPPTADGPDGPDDIGGINIGAPTNIFSGQRPTLVTIQRRNRNTEGQVLHG